MQLLTAAVVVVVVLTLVVIVDAGVDAVAVAPDCQTGRRQRIAYRIMGGRFAAQLVPSIVFTTRCPYNATRKGRRARLICMQSVFSVVSLDSNRESWCRVGGSSSVTN